MDDRNTYDLDDHLADYKVMLCVLGSFYLLNTQSCGLGPGWYGNNP